MRILLTGASGFIGTHLLQKLILEGHQVLAFSRSARPKKNKYISWHQCDLSLQESYSKEVEDFLPEVLIHLAWQDIPDFSVEKSKANLDLSLDFLKCVLNLNCCKKILFSGSCLEYDLMDGMCKETSMVEGLVNDFAWAKNTLRIKSELLCREKSVNFIWFRIFYVYGPGQRTDSLIPSIFKHLKLNNLPEIDSPNNANDYIYIDDVVEGFSIAITESISSGIYNLGTGRSTSVLEVCRIAEKIILNSSKLTFQLELKVQPKVSDVNFWASMISTNQHLKFNPKVGLSYGIKKFWESYR